MAVDINQHFSKEPRGALAPQDPLQRGQELEKYCTGFSKHHTSYQHINVLRSPITSKSFSFCLSILSQNTPSLSPFLGNWPRSPGSCDKVSRPSCSGPTCQSLVPTAYTPPCLLALKPGRPILPASLQCAEGAWESIRVSVGPSVQASLSQVFSKDKAITSDGEKYRRAGAKQTLPSLLEQCESCQP